MKLHRPGNTRDLVIRPRLLTLMDGSVERPLTIVVAPAGFGKTTLVSSWIEAMEAGGRPGVDKIPTAWLSLDEADGDPNMFLRYFIAALRTLFPGAAPKTFELLRGQGPSLSVLADTLSNEIEDLPSRFVMVLDDAHLLPGRDVFDFLNIWIPHWPRRLHLVISSRLSPTLPLTNLRAKEQVLEVRSRDLRFTSSEAAKYLSLASGLPLEQPGLSALNDSLEGWIAGLKLAMLSVDIRSESLVTLQEILDGDAYIADYLLNEVLMRQPASIQRFLLGISIAPQFCESLAAAILGEDPGCDVRQCLDYLEANELFLTGLDNRREWYRLHQLLRDLLQRRLVMESGPDVLNELHGRAAGWYARHNLLEPALYHALEAKDLAQVVDIMQQGLCEVLNRTDRPTLERWLRMLPEETILQSPELLLMRAWGQGLRWELSQGRQTIKQLETLLESRRANGAAVLSPAFRGQLAALKAHGAYHLGEMAEEVAFSREALALLPEEWAYARGVAGAYLGMALHASGQIAEAERFLTTSYEEAPDKTGFYPNRLLNSLALNALQSGYFETVKRTSQIVLQQSTPRGLAVSIGWAHLLEGYVHYQWNDLEAAREHFEATLNVLYTTQLLVTRNGMIGLAMTYSALGEPDKALATLDELGDFDLELYGREQPATTAARARLLWLRGDADGAALWLEQTPFTDPRAPLMPWAEEPYLTRVAILLDRGGTGDIEAAHHILDLLEKAVQQSHCERSMVEILALRAVAIAAQGDLTNARQTLIKSVELSRRSGRIRVYLDLGAPMARLMRTIAGHRTVARSAAAILAAFESNGLPATPGDGVPDAVVSYHVSSSSNGDQLMLDPLTAREREILALLVEPMSLTDIADRLCISRGTVGRHTINLYQKLGVHGRWEAVNRAVELGILSAR